MKKQYSFSNIKLTELQSIVDLQPKSGDDVFKKWFAFNYEISDEEESFLERLITANKIRMSYYSEVELRMKLMAPLLNKVNFTSGEITGWYKRFFSGIINGVELEGITDYLVAAGYDEPEVPYFFIQEFKPSIVDNDPQSQLLAELMATMQINQYKEMIGIEIIRKIWDFILVGKIKDNAYTYSITP